MLSHVGRFLEQYAVSRTQLCHGAPLPKLLSFTSAANVLRQALVWGRACYVASTARDFIDAVSRTLRT